MTNYAFMGAINFYLAWDGNIAPLESVTRSNLYYSIDDETYEPIMTKKYDSIPDGYYVIADVSSMTITKPGTYALYVWPYGFYDPEDYDFNPVFIIVDDSSTPAPAPEATPAPAPEVTPASEPEAIPVSESETTSTSEPETTPAPESEVTPETELEATPAPEETAAPEPEATPAPVAPVTPAPEASAPAEPEASEQSAVTYFEKSSYTGPSIVDALKSIKVDSSFRYRALIAAKNGITGYKGTAEQNIKLLDLFKQGKLIKP